MDIFLYAIILTALNNRFQLPSIKRKREKNEEVTASAGEASCSQMDIHLKITRFLFSDFKHQPTNLFIYFGFVTS